MMNLEESIHFDNDAHNSRNNCEPENRIHTEYTSTYNFRHLFKTGIPDSLSAQALSIWAKTNLTDPSSPEYLQLWQHLEDTAAVFTHVWNNFLPDHIRTTLASDLDGPQSAYALTLFLCGIHDVGKASPAFEMMNFRGATRVQKSGLVIETDFPGIEHRSLIRHELVGYDTILAWLKYHINHHDPSASNNRDLMLFATGIANVVGGHHGTSIGAEKRCYLRHSYGQHLAGLRKAKSTSASWQDCRFNFLDWMAAVTDLNRFLPVLSTHPIPKRSQTLLTATVIICDWIASNVYYFPLNKSSYDESTFDADYRAARAWALLGIPRPWRPPMQSHNYDLLFSKRFSIPNALLRPSQRAAIETADAMDKPGLMIIEANMGEGKTEAALLAAERLAARFHLGGVYYALPTQATVNAMFSRFVDWIEHLPSGNRPATASLFLAHSKRDLNDEFTQLQRNRNFDHKTISDEESATNADTEERLLSARNERYAANQRVSATVNSWLSGRKRGNLSDFVVGTIDQVLMAGLRSKHVVLRHLALAGKVIVLDEIHANTAYMNVFMETVLSWLAYYEIPVIMLSATLPQNRRLAYLRAYMSGRKALENEHQTLKAKTVHNMSTANDATKLEQQNCTTHRRRRQSSDVQHNNVLPTVTSIDLRYPLISTTADRDEPQFIAPSPSGRTSQVQVRYCDDSDETLLSLLRNQLADGGCAIVIRNTVSRAQHTYQLIYEQLAQPLDAEITLAHSRFLAFDRAHIDHDLVQRFGPNGKRPHCAIVVATQVAEQSLDVDFDLMITDIAPIDLILQRVGRLHRHRRNDNERPKQLRKPQLFITGITEWPDNDVPIIDTGTVAVYGKHLLLRSLAALNIAPGKNRTLNIPSDIPQLVQTVYGEQSIGPSSWQQTMQRAESDWKNQQELKENNASQYRIMSPEDSPFDLNGWLENNLLDDSDNHSENTRSSVAAVRDSIENVEVIVLCRSARGLQLPEWGKFRSTNPLPNGLGQPTREQSQDILSCTISLNRYSLGCSIDSFIEAVERLDTDTDLAATLWQDWQQIPELTGQLLLPLDDNGRIDLTVADYSIDNDGQGRAKRPAFKTIHYRYSPETGWSILRDE